RRRAGDRALDRPRDPGARRRAPACHRRDPHEHLVADHGAAASVPPPCAAAARAHPPRPERGGAMIAFGTAMVDPEAYRRYARPGIELAREPDSEVYAFAAVGAISRSYNLVLEQVAAVEGLEA